jgi:hypothetical protein
MTPPANATSYRWNCFTQVRGLMGSLPDGGQGPGLLTHGVKSRESCGPDPHGTRGMANDPETRECRECPLERQPGGPADPGGTRYHLDPSQYGLLDPSHQGRLDLELQSLLDLGHRECGAVAPSPIAASKQPGRGSARHGRTLQGDGYRPRSPAYLLIRSYRQRGQ